ncbi:hypothetical protein SBDP1_170002 [Syntrophobacter sp. SbD1]|nr:hypothetical protein SBDP1_170002 [Syntrophobacter sp. SbD1]
MIDEDFDPKKFINREFEQELFEELLQLKDTSRILAIQDNGGMGKSQLLEKFKYRCRTIKPRTPVSLVKLDQLPGDSPLDLVNILVKDLSPRFDFSNFNRYESARIFKDLSPIRAAIDLHKATFNKAKDVTIAEVATHVDHADTVNISPGSTEFSSDIDRKAKEVCLSAFFDDLKEHCANERIVLMFDTYDKSSKNVKDWIEEQLLEQLFFDCENRPKQLILVIAGREIPDFERRWSAEDYKATVRSVRALGQWNKKHVEECLLAFGFDYKPEDLDAFYRLVQRGLPPSDVVHLIISMVNAPFGRG